MLFYIEPSPFTGTTLTHKMYEGRKSKTRLSFTTGKIGEYNTE